MSHPDPITGTNVPSIIGLIRELEARCTAIEQRLTALENPPCCNGGPQWGHAPNCPKLP